MNKKKVITLMISISFVLSALMTGCVGIGQAQPQSEPASSSAASQSSEASTSSAAGNPNAGGLSGQAGLGAGQVQGGGTSTGRMVIYNQIPEIGGIVQFGAYEQDNDFGNGEEPIEWIVLKKSDNSDSYLLMSLYCLDQIDYDYREKTDVYDCELTKWLNDDFYNVAFLPEEKKVMNRYQTTYNGKVITDMNVSLMPSNLIKTYMKGDSDRVAMATEYAKARGAEIQGGHCWYWLMPVHNKDKLIEDYAACVNYNGTIMEPVSINQSSGGAVRPVIAVRLDELIQ